ncbi:MAG: putative adenylosuccinate synthetase [Prokaryotic dsDNA virus sp.]|nr:MAG: putative adenylosuccinate synthetase [Prokaryotic dsDNA virus sp.]
MENREIDAILDLQFGSTGKGAVAGFMSRLKKYDVAVTAWMPNAGHTYITANKHKMVHTALANACVSPSLKWVLIAPASVLDVKALLREASEAVAAGYMKQGVCIAVHENATILKPEYSQFERDNIKSIGSTQKGSGAAIMAKITRDPQKSVTAGQYYPHGMIGGTECGSVEVRVVKHAEYKEILREGKTILLEGAQGYSLGVHTGFYPFTTSRECTIAQLCSDCLVSPDAITTVFGCARTYPIRVANRFADGVMTGWSGPHYKDQYETTFDSLGQETEKTTVTKLPRRVFSWSRTQVSEAIEANMPSKLKVILTFCDYVTLQKGEDTEGMDHPEIQDMKKDIENAGAQLGGTTWGPNHDDFQFHHGS